MWLSSFPRALGLPRPPSFLTCLATRSPLCLQMQTFLSDLPFRREPQASPTPGDTMTRPRPALWCLPACTPP